MENISFKELWNNPHVTGHALVNPAQMYVNQIGRIFSPLPPQGKVHEVASRILVTLGAILALPLALGILFPLALLGMAIKYHNYVPKDLTLTPPRTPPGPASAPESPHTSSSTAVMTTEQQFYQVVEHWSLLEGVLIPYEAASKDPAWQNEKGKKFLHSELVTMQAEAGNLLIKAKEIYNKKLEGTTLSVDDLKQLNSLIANSKDLEDKYKDLIVVLAPPVPKTPEPRTVLGFANAGNTCYINSALQPLLAINNFSDLVPEKLDKKDANETSENFEKRKNILKDFKGFLAAWKNKETPQKLGQLIGDLRKTIFEAGLFEGGFMNKAEERSFQDAGSFFELILFVIGKRFQLKSEKTFKLPDGKDLPLGRPEPYGVLFLSAVGSVQEKIDALAKPMQDKLDDPYQHTDPNTKKVSLLIDYTETTKICGNPQELLVLRVNHHPVDSKKDRLINCAALFEDFVPAAEANYELVGFCQNHYQTHWTSVVHDGKRWKSCNDRLVEDVSTNDIRFTHPASYMIYKRKV